MYELAVGSTNLNTASCKLSFLLLLYNDFVLDFVSNIDRCVKLRKKTSTLEYNRRCKIFFIFGCSIDNTFELIDVEKQ